MLHAWQGIMCAAFDDCSDDDDDIVMVHQNSKAKVLLNTLL